MDSRHEARERLRKLPDEQRTAWLDTAEDEFRSHGFEGASLNRILMRAGISKGQAYYYFTDKGELYRAVIERALAVFADALGARLPAPESASGYWLEVAEFFAKVTTFLKRDERLAELGRGIYREAAAQTAVADLLDILHDHLKRLIEVGQRVGAVRSDLPLTMLADTAFALAREIDRWFAMNAQALDERKALELNRRAVSLVVAMLAPVEKATGLAEAILSN